MHDFFRDLEYTGKPEFFSAVTCLLLGKGMKVNPEWLHDRQRDLQRFSKQYYLQHGLCMVPARVVRAICRGLDSVEP